ncbi:MAG: hypothetical protein M5R36_14785 [Deltaproteobacteria bacterium]|nr:hypothetical protein [Deltaproteobacteria bacterium]
MLAALIGASMAVKASHDFAVTAEMMHLGVYGETVGEAVATLVSRPVFVLSQIFSPLNAAHLSFLGAFLFLPFLGGVFILAALPEFGLWLMSTTSIAGRTFFQNVYPDFYDPAVFIHNDHFYLTGLLMGAFAVGAARLIHWAKGRWKTVGARGAWGTVLAASIAAHVFWPPLLGGPMPGNVHYDARYYRQSAHDRLGWEIAQTIPRGVPARAQWNLYQEPLPQREVFRAFEWFRDDVNEEFVFVDLFSFEYLISRDVYLATVRAVTASERYGVVRFEDGYILLKRDAPRHKNAEVLSYLDSHTELLSRNLYRPFRSAALPEPRPAVDLYSATQIP